MSDKDFVNQLLRVEEDVDVNRLEYKGLCIWPLVRWMLVDKNQHHLKGDATSDTKYLSFSSFISYPIKKVASFLLHPNSIFQLLSDRISAKPSKGEILCLNMVSAKFQAQQGKSFSRFTDSMGALLDQEISVRDIEVFFESNAVYHTRVKAPLYIDSVILKTYAKLLSQKLTNSKESIPGFEKLERVIDQETTLQGVSEAAVLKRAAFVLHLKAGLMKWLRAKNPPLVIVAPYYHDTGMALAAACKELRIPCAELQHGKQGSYHYMYSHWSKIPEQGYELLPQLFWMWGASSKAVIDDWANKTAYHKAIISGNPWLSYNKSQVQGSDSSITKPKTWDLFSTKALISMQPIEGFFPKALLAAMATTSEVLWLIRPHPKMMGDIEKIKTLLDKAGVDYELEYAAEQNLYLLFKEIDLNITYWSSVAYESISFGVPTMIAHPNGAEIMSEYLTAGVFMQGLSKEEILAGLKEPRMNPETSTYIEVDAKLIRNAFAESIA